MSLSLPLPTNRLDWTMHIRDSNDDKSGWQIKIYANKGRRITTIVRPQSNGACVYVPADFIQILMSN
ncbi:MAG: hypothetical protein WA421_18685 [Nitrososphaeraceae archaeon]